MQQSLHFIRVDEVKALLQFDEVGAPRIQFIVQRSAFTSFLLRSRALQNLDDLRLSVLLREGEGRAAVLVLGVHVGAVLDE